MNILILGSGGREHALAWKMSQSKLLKNLYTAPGNSGTSLLGQNVDLVINDFEGIHQFCMEKDIQMIVVGPEAPLVEGCRDYFVGTGIYVVGPDMMGAMLEGSKSFSKQFMLEFGIPTAAYLEVDRCNIDDGLAYISKMDLPIVLKADGLAAGKGVLIIHNHEEANSELRKMLNGKFGKASEKIVIESFLDGVEFSMFVLTNTEQYVLMPIAKDYKRIGEGDTGLNTGGMGAVSPVPFVDELMITKVKQRIVEPTLAGLRKRKISYHGFIFIGLIKVDDEPYVIEYNCRLGDPETEVILPRLENDLVDLFVKMRDGRLDEVTVEEKDKFASTIVLVSGGYPGHYEKNIPIEILETSASILFHAGMKQVGQSIVTSGGRVCAITSLGSSIEDCIQASQKSAEKIKYIGKYYRRDIGLDLI